MPNPNANLQAATETFVAVPPNVPGGPNIRQLSLVLLQPDGTLATVLVEAVSIVDAATGVPLDLVGQDWRDEMLKLQRAMVKGLENLCVAMDVDSDLLDQSQTDE